jgi:acetylornithine/N-succinyldiaminopimelate aminotransferase
VPYGDAEALHQAVDSTVAAVFLEPTQGEGGVIPAPAGYLAAARSACDAAGALLVLDEIQSGIGRTGVWFAHQAEGVLPDVLTLAKGLGGGLPIGACVAFGDSSTALAKGDHGSTFGGNPVACAAALAVLDTIEREDILASVKTVGESLANGIDAIDHPLLGGVRGSGLWLAAVLTADSAPAVYVAAQDAGFLVNAVQPDAIRLAPPLVLTQAEAAEFTAALPAILTRAQGA